MSTERRKAVRAITQTTGARVVSAVPAFREGQVGVVTGHYDDDSVYVTWAGESAPERVATDALDLAEPLTVNRATRRAAERLGKRTAEVPPEHVTTRGRYG